MRSQSRCTKPTATRTMTGRRPPRSLRRCERGSLRNNATNRLCRILGWSGSRRAPATRTSSIWKRKSRPTIAPTRATNAHRRRQGRVALRRAIGPEGHQAAVAAGAAGVRHNELKTEHRTRRRTTQPQHRQPLCYRTIRWLPQRVALEQHAGTLAVLSLRGKGQLL